MSFKYNHFLLSACLPVIAFTTFTIPLANAGFEWNPPKVEEVKPETAAIPSITPKPLEAIDNVSVGTPANIKTTEEQTPEAPQNIKIAEEQKTTPPEIKLLPLVDDTEEQAIIIPELSLFPLDDDNKEQKENSVEVNLFPIGEGNEEQITDTTEAVVLSHDNVEVAAEEKNDAIIIEPTTPAENVNWNTPETFNIIEGFGSDMPLALALRQIVPAEYAFSFGDNVNAGDNISWTGGRPWNETLKDAIAPLNITFEIKGKKIILKLDKTAEATIIDLQEPLTKKKTVKTAQVLDEVIEAESAPVTISPPAAAEEEASPEQVKKKVPIGIHQQEELIFTPANKIENTTLQNNDADAVITEQKNPSNIDDIIWMDHEVLIEEEKPSLDNELSTILEEEKAPEEAIVIEEEKVSTLTPTQPEIEQPLSQEVEETAIIEISEEDTPEPKIKIITPTSTPKNDSNKAPSLRDKPSNDIKIWEAKQGANLKKILDKWSEEEQVLFKWSTTKKYKLDKDVFISGTFENAVSILFSKGLRNAPKYYIIEEESYELHVGKK